MKPLRIKIETRMFKYSQRFPFLVTDTFLYQSFDKGINFEKQLKVGWINHEGKHVEKVATLIYTRGNPGRELQT